MNPSFDNGLDYIVISIGCLAAIVGIVLLVRMFRKPRSPKQDQALPPPIIPQPPQNKGKKPYIRINPKRQDTPSLTPAAVDVPTPIKEDSAAVQERLQTVAVTHFEDSLLDVADTPTPALQEAHVSKAQPTMLRLALTVRGDTLIYQKISLGDWNELQVSYEPPIFRKQESYAPGTALNFHISGEQLDTRTYQFFVHYKDNSGRAYRQEIGGMGTENPIVEGPVAIGDWQ
ncbi:MAG: hypothetical protein AAF587_20815 [Bacteroidota bacterium]